MHHIASDTFCHVCIIAGERGVMDRYYSTPDKRVPTVNISNLANELVLIQCMRLRKERLDNNYIIYCGGQVTFICKVTALPYFRYW
jgi:hypothetical protein